MTRSLESIKRRAEKRGNSITTQKKLDWESMKDVEKEKEKEKTKGSARSANPVGTSSSSSPKSSSKSLDKLEKHKKRSGDAEDASHEEEGEKEKKESPAEEKTSGKKRTVKDSHSIEDDSAKKAKSRKLDAPTPVVVVTERVREQKPKQASSQTAVATTTTTTAAAGEWTCPQCQNTNFAVRMQCFRCRTEKPAAAIAAVVVAKPKPKTTPVVAPSVVKQLPNAINHVNAVQSQWPTQAPPETLEENARLRSLGSLSDQDKAGSAEWQALSEEQKARCAVLIQRSKRKEGKAAKYQTDKRDAERRRQNDAKWRLEKEKKKR